MRTLRAATFSLVALIAAACSPAIIAGSTPAPPRLAEPPAGAYVALGASETSGLGTDHPSRSAFPQHLLARLGRGTVLYNLGIPAETTAAALTDELPAAVSARPQIATVFFNVDDLVAGVPVSDFESRLDQIVAALSAGGHTRVLVANTVPIDQLPAFAACGQGLPSCPLKGVAVPSAAAVEALVSQYNQAIARVAAAHGARLVDLTSAGAAVVAHPDYVGRDGLHPSEAGARALADAFASALKTG